MRAFRSIMFFVLVATVSCFVFAGCTVNADDSGKIPITTSSQTAREKYLKGRDLLEKLRIAEARPYFEKAVSDDPDFALAHLNLANTSPTFKDFFSSLNKAVELSGNASVGERLFILATEAGANGEPTKQQKYFEELLAKFPKDERAQSNLGNFYFGQQDWEKAISYYEASLEINPEFSQPYNQLGYSYRFMGKYNEAEKTFKKYTEVIPDDPNPYDSYAELLMKIGRYEESIEKYKEALKVNPQFVASNIGIATNYCYLHDGESARKQLQKQYDNAENIGQKRGALLAEAVTYVFEGQPDKALESQKKAFDLAKSNNDPGAMSGDLGIMGNVLVEFGQPDKAIAKFEESLKLILDSDLSQEQKDLAQQFHYFNTYQVAIAKNDIAKAKTQAEKFKANAEAKQNRFQIRLVHQMLGSIAAVEEDYETAIAELKQANLQNPYNLYRLSIAYKAKGDSEMAQDYYQKAMNFNALNSLQQAFVFAHTDKMMSMKN